ncbi:hypothetical protein PENTCL1PPCAC_14461, partial [Pristionchus entomophagus]
AQRFVLATCEINLVPKLDTSMTVSPWAIAARIVVSIEAVCGVVLNLLLLYLLARLDVGRAARLYRISCMITALLGSYTSFLLLLLEDLVILVEGGLAVVLYGPILFYLPDKINDVLCIGFFTQTHTMWQTIAAPSIIQWMYLAMPNSSDARRLFCAYIVPIICYANTLYYMQYIIPDDAMKTTLVRSIYDLHGTDLRDFHIYGFRMIDEDGIDLRDIMLREAVPSYIAAYGMFIFSAVQIRSRLRGFGSITSTKTDRMQRRFFHIQIAQVLLPLVLMSPPMGIALVAGFNGANFASLTIILDFFLWITPSATAFLLLIFVVKSSRNRSAKTSHVGISNNYPSPRVPSNSSRTAA